jgi:hypothetical protein
VANALNNPKRKNLILYSVAYKLLDEAIALIPFKRTHTLTLTLWGNIAGIKVIVIWGKQKVILNTRRNGV